jgi:uncharacterized membrane protein required for colicin V production
VTDASFADVALLVVVGLFAFAGWLRGVWRQALALVLLGGAFVAADRFGPGIQGSVAKVSSFDDHGRCLAGWCVVLVGTVVVGSVLLRWVGGLLSGLRAPAVRALAALLGAARGAVVVTVALYALLSWNDGPARPAFVGALERATTSSWARRGVDALRRVVPLPPCVDVEAARVGARIGASTGARVGALGEAR